MRAFASQGLSTHLSRSINVYKTGHMLYAVVASNQHCLIGKIQRLRYLHAFSFRCKTLFAVLKSEFIFKTDYRIPFFPSCMLRGASDSFINDSFLSYCNEGYVQIKAPVPHYSLI